MGMVEGAKNNPLDACPGASEVIALIDGDLIVYTIGYTTELEDVEEAHWRTDAFIDSIILATGAIDYKVYLSDSSENNFRYKINPEYKAHRTQPKPVHYDAIKEYLITKHKAKIAYNREADDELGIMQIRDLSCRKIIEEEPSTIICSIDKDMDMIPGLHYSWPIYRKGEIVREGRIYTVTEDEGLRFFYKQLCVGDTSDNIRGIDGLGPKKTEKLFEGVPTEDLVEVVADKYKEQWGDIWYEEMRKNSLLLWIKRSEEENELTPVERYYQQSFKEVGVW